MPRCWALMTGRYAVATKSWHDEIDIVRPADRTGGVRRLTLLADLRVGQRARILQGDRTSSATPLTLHGRKKQTSSGCSPAPWDRTNVAARGYTTRRVVFLFGWTSAEVCRRVVHEVARYPASREYSGIRVPSAPLTPGAISCFTARGTRSNLRGACPVCATQGTRAQVVHQVRNPRNAGAVN